MWRVNKTGQEQVWYEAELIEQIKEICYRRPYQALDKILDLITKVEEE